MNPTQSLVSQPQYDQLSVNYLGSAGQQRFIVLLCLNCLCANLAYGLQELNKTYLLTYRLPSQFPRQPASPPRNHVEARTAHKCL